MYCRNCNAPNPENSRFCNNCGAPLAGTEPQQGPCGEQTAPINNSSAIISLIVNIAIFNIVGLIFAILSLMNYNNYEAAIRVCNFPLAENYKNASKKYSKIALIFAGLLFAAEIVVVIIVFICTSILSVGVLNNVFDSIIHH